MKIDNEVRAEFGLPQLEAYPLNLREYIPTTKEEFWQRFLGIKIERKDGELPKSEDIWEEAEGITEAIGMDKVEEEAMALYKQLFPQTVANIDKKHLSFCRTSIIQRHEIELARIDVKKTKELKEEKTEG